MSRLTSAIARGAERIGLDNGRLSRRLLAWFLLFSLVPLLATNAVGYQRSRTILQSLIERELDAIAATEADHVRDRVDRQVLMLQAIVSGNDFLAAGAMRAQGQDAGEMGTVANRTALTRFLDHKLNELPGFESVYLVTAGGRVAAFAGPRAAVVSTPPWTDANSRFIERFRRDDNGSQPEFRIAAPIRNRYGEAIAYLGASVNLQGFKEFLQIPPHLAGHVEGFVVDESGRPLFVSHPHVTIDYAAELSSPLIHRPAGSHERYHAADGEDVIGSIAAVPGYPWRFITEVPTSEAFGALRRLGGISLALELLLVGMLISVALIVARDIVAPVRSLVTATRKVADGKLDTRIANTQQDEIGELQRAFNDMTAALSETTARVRELHQEEIQRAAQLATVGELASGVAHEVKNPVIGIAHGLDLVRRRVGRDPVVAPIMDEMARQLARIQQTLQELLTFARPATPTLGPVGGNELVDRAIRLVQPAADRAGVQINVQKDASIPRILADEEMLHQALVNVLMNAVQATPSGGLVTVGTSRQNDDVQIEINDTGRGIAESNLELVFKPFFTTRHMGTGLGLSITREIVQRHGGSVTLSSQPGAGTTVRVRLPISAARAGAAPAARPALEEAHAS